MMNSDKNSNNSTNSGVALNAIKNTDNKRGGRGSKGEPSEIKESITKAQEDVVRIDLTLSKLKNEKEGLLRTIANFRIKERHLVGKGLATDVADIRKAIVKAQNEVDKINGVVPESTALDDHRKIQSIVSEYYAERQKAKDATEKIRQAEKKLEIFPSDGRAMGDAIRGETEKAEAEELLDKAERQAELILKNSIPSPAQDEGVHHTNEETIKEKDYLRTRNIERVALGVIGHKEARETAQKETDEIVIPKSMGEPEEVPEVVAPESSSNVSAYNEVAEIIPESAPLRSAYNVAMERLLKERVSKKSAENIVEAEITTEHVDDSLLPIVIEPMAMTTAVPAKNQEVSAGVEMLESTHKLRKILPALRHLSEKISAFFEKQKEEQVVEPIIEDVKPATVESPSETDSQPIEQAEAIVTEAPEVFVEPGEFLERPLFTEFESSGQQDVVITPEQTIIPPSEPDTPEISVVQEQKYMAPNSDAPAIQETSQEEQADTVIQEYVPLMPQEIAPGSHDVLLQVETQADEVLRDDMDKLFGESRFIGLKHTHGLDSINWKDPQVGFCGKTVTEILGATPTEGLKTFGVENLEATNKMKSYINNVTNMSGVNPSENELVEDFIRRASVTKLSK